MRYFFLTSAVLFLIFALFQLNDPDPAIWVIAYGATALLAFFAFRGRYYYISSGIIAIVFLVFSVLLFPLSPDDWWRMEEQSASLKMTMPGIEEARESIGLLLAASVLILITIRGWLRRQSNRFDYLQ